jgi:hypothetical protein
MGRTNGPGLQSGGGPCLKRGMSKPLRHGSGHTNSHFETASSPTSEYLEFPRHTHSSTLSELGIVVLRSPLHSG